MKPLALTRSSFPFIVPLVISGSASKILLTEFGINFLTSSSVKFCSLEPTRSSPICLPSLYKEGRQIGEDLVGSRLQNLTEDEVKKLIPNSVNKILEADPEITRGTIKGNELLVNAKGFIDVYDKEYVKL